MVGPTRNLISRGYKWRSQGRRLRRAYAPRPGNTTYCLLSRYFSIGFIAILLEAAKYCVKSSVGRLGRGLSETLFSMSLSPREVAPFWGSSIRENALSWRLHLHPIDGTASLTPKDLVGRLIAELSDRDLQLGERSTTCALARQLHFAAVSFSVFGSSSSTMGAPLCVNRHSQSLFRLSRSAAQSFSFAHLHTSAKICR
jgi:hypothetical protein